MPSKAPRVLYSVTSTFFTSLSGVSFVCGTTHRVISNDGDEDLCWIRVEAGVSQQKRATQVIQMEVTNVLC